MSSSSSMMSKRSRSMTLCLPFCVVTLRGSLGESIAAGHEVFEPLQELAPVVVRFHAKTAGCGEALAGGGVAKQGHDSLTEFPRPLGDEEITPSHGAYAGKSRWARHDGHTHGHGFQHLVLESPGHPQRSNSHGGGVEERSDVFDPAGDHDPIAVGQASNGGRGIHTYDAELRLWYLPPDPRQDLGREMTDGLHVRPIGHVPGENDPI